MFNKVNTYKIFFYNVSVYYYNVECRLYIYKCENVYAFILFVYQGWNRNNKNT